MPLHCFVIFGAAVKPDACLPARAVRSVGQPRQGNAGEADPFAAVLLAALVHQADVAVGQPYQRRVGRWAGVDQFLEGPSLAFVVAQLDGHLRPFGRGIGF